MFISVIKPASFLKTALMKRPYPMLLAAIEKVKLSARTDDRILKLARSISDLAAEETIGVSYIAVAV